MRFTAVILGALATLALAQDSASTTATTAVENTQTAQDPAQSSAYEEALKCIKTCDPADVNCQAKCQGLPFPNEGQVNATTECVAACPQGDGKDVAADTQKFAECRDKCIADHYLTNTAGPAATGTSGSGSGSGSQTTGTGSSNATPTGTSGSGNSNGGASNTSGGSGSSNGGTQTSSGATTPTNAAGNVRVGGAAVAAVGFLAAVAAL